jgi:hypothetical protein
MKRVDCPFEADVLNAVYTNRWPERVDAELRSHVPGCVVCSDVVDVARAIEEEFDIARAEARVPESGLVWWRAQMRARQEAAREAVRPITIAQAVGLAATVGVLGAVFGATTTWFQHALHWLGGGLSSLLAFRLPELSPSLVTLVTEHSFLLAGAAACLLLAPLAVYLAVRED